MIVVKVIFQRIILKSNYLVAVFESGNCDLYAQTRDLLLYNRQRLAEQEIRREKAQQMTM